MAIDISGLLNKTENDGSTDAGRLTATEWNTLVQAVEENQRAVNGAVKSVNYNGTDYKDVRDGVLYMTVLGDTGRNVKFEWIQNPPTTISKGGECYLEFNVIDREKDADDASKLVPYDQPGKVNFYLDEKLINTVSGVYDPTYSKYTGPIKFDYSKVTNLSTKTDGNTLKIEYVNSGVVISKYFTVYVLDLSLTVENVSSIYTSEDKPNIKVTVRGAGSEGSKLYASVDDKTPLAIDGASMIDGVPDYIDAELDDFNTHGTHTLKVWAAPNAYADVVTDEQVFNYIYGNTSNKTPIVMSTVTEGSSFELYGKMKVEYVAYVSGENGDKDVTINIVDETNKVLLGTTQKISFVNGKGSDSYTFTLFPSGTDTLTGSRKLVIGITDTDGVEHKHITNITIAPSTVALEQTPGYLVYLSSNGRSNSESDDTKRVWSSVSDTKDKTVVDVTFDDSIEFLNTGSGWIADKDGNVAMHLKKGSYFTLNHTPFKWNPTYKNDANGNGNGLTISIEFATRNCLNSNAKVIDCMDYTQEETGRGFYVTASDMKLLANDISLHSKFKEDTRIKLDIVIEGTLTKYSYDTVVGTDPSASDYVQTGESYECLALVFVDGVYNGVTLVKNSTSFQQGSSIVDPQKIRFGSADCDLDIYNIRIYDRALTFNEIVKNYSYDTPKFEDKIAISQRNDIFSSATNNMPKLDIGKLRKARPELPFFYIKLDPSGDMVLPQNKSDWKLLEMTQWQNPMATSGEADEALTSFEAKTGVLRNQGTSSMTYPWPWRNWDWKTGDSDFGDKSTFKYYFPDITNTKETSSKWHQYEYQGAGDDLPLKKLTFKKDYASSEMCNNAICSELFTDMALGIAKAYPNALSPAMKTDVLDETKKYTNFRLSLKAKPCFMFQTLNDPNAEGTAGTGIDGLGMMNLIPNKNEVGYLGFKQNKWENADKGATEREQSWELGDNLDDVFWVKKLDYFKRDSKGNFVNMVKDIYEARTPKDSSVKWGGDLEADFGMTPKGKDTVEYDQAQTIVDEQRDIVDFHNWLVDCNQHLATDEDLKGSREPWNVDETGNTKYTKDTKEYRKAKFAAEARDRLILDQWIMYYIWREQFWMFDSGLKNLQVYTVGPNPENPTSAHMQWGCMVRDADTALGIENTGKDYFPPHIEDIDYYTEADGVIKFHYGKAKDIHDITELEAKYGKTAKAVLNGQFASVWVNIRDNFGAEIAAMYRTLCNNSNVTYFGAEAAINKFRNHQENWCENLYNFGMRQYFGGSPFSYFNKSALGDKKNSRASWLERAFYYRRGKYRTLTDSSAFRINTYSSPDEVNPELNIKAYIPMYLGCGGTTAEMVNSKNIIRLVDDTYEDGAYGRPVSTGETGFNFPNAGDAVSYIYGTSMLTDIGDLARVCKLLRVQNMNFPKLRELNLGHEKTRTSVCGKPCEPGPYREYATNYILNEKGELVADGTVGVPQEFKNEILPNLDCSTLTQLTLLDVTNHTNLSDLVIDKCTQLQELYARGTIMKSINLPATTSLKKIYLGSKLTSLQLVDLTGITDFVVEGLNDCGRLVIQNCGAYMAKESYKILNQAIMKLEQVYDPVTNPNVLSLRGVNWENADQETLMRLIAIDADLTGDITIKGLTNDNKIKLINGYIDNNGVKHNGYGNIDDPKNPLRIKYTQSEIKSASIAKKMYIFQEGEHQLSFSVTPTTANTYKSAKWEISANAFATMKDAEKGILERNGDVADETVSAEIKVTIYQLPRTDGSERTPIELTSTVYFYERVALPGDIVYSDGSYSDEYDPYDSTKKPIGICFYVDKTNSDRRLMCALESLPNATWGCQAGGITAEGNWYGTSPYINFGGKGDGINGSNEYCFNIEAIKDISSEGITRPADSNINDTNVFLDEYYRDATNINNDYFKAFRTTEAFGDMGWNVASEEIYIDQLNLPNGAKSITIKKGDNIPSGYYKTLACIQQRNNLLDEYRNAYDVEDSFVRPYSNEYEDETYVLQDLMNQAMYWPYEDRDNTADSRKQTGGNTLYYGCASMCFAYEPSGFTGENSKLLADKFKQRNWFLPASGDLIRIMYYIHHSYANGNAVETPANSVYDQTSKGPANAFYNAIKLGVFRPANMVYGYDFASSTERDYYSVWTSTHSGRVSNSSKMNSMAIIPVCAF